MLNPEACLVFSSIFAEENCRDGRYTLKYFFMWKLVYGKTRFTLSSRFVKTVFLSQVIVLE